MSEELTHDPLLGKLVRFTPHCAGVDRDELLFAAGRASAPKAHKWKLALAVLAICQVGTLAAWFAGVTVQKAPSIPLVKPAEQQKEVPDLPAPSAAPDPAGSYVEIVRQWEHDGFPPPSSIADPMPSGPVLSIATGQRILGND
jgi:hypothetical protein